MGKPETDGGLRAWLSELGSPAKGIYAAPGQPDRRSLTIAQGGGVPQIGTRMNDQPPETPVTPPDIESAALRLDEAVRRLEGRLDGLFDRLEAAAGVERETEALRIDRNRLAGDLDAARSRERELQRLADDASEALGAAISEVREALGKV